MAIGFGEAGSEIIATNMQKGGEVDPMLPGRKCLAVFGFCDIRNFTDVYLFFKGDWGFIARSDDFCERNRRNCAWNNRLISGISEQKHWRCFSISMEISRGKCLI